MKKKNLVIYDTEETYAKKICEYFRSKAGDTLEQFLFTKEEPLNEFIGSNRADILLASDISDMRIKDKVGTIVRLSRTPVSETEEGMIYKYSAADDLLRKVLSLGSAETAGSAKRSSGSISVIGVYSPIKRCFQTTFALTMGQILARKKKTLYLCFETFSGFDLMEGRKTGNDLMDLLYFSECDTGNFSLRIGGMAERIGELDYVPPVRLYSKYKDISKDQWIRLIDRIRSETDYEVLIMDLSEQVGGLFDVLDDCDRVYTIDASDSFGRAKMSQFEIILGETGYSHLKDRIKKVKIPRYEGIPDEPSMLPYTELAEYVKTIINDLE
ncbi:MAG: hypothetical protein K6E19_11080 [Lachnospiraceae bacterium]|nr:hypothetical protein [Lachnospiraceae bacterium]